MGTDETAAATLVQGIKGFRDAEAFSSSVKRRLASEMIFDADSDMVYRPVRADSADSASRLGACLAGNSRHQRARSSGQQANIATTRVYDHRRKTRPEDSPTFKVAY